MNLPEMLVNYRSDVDRELKAIVNGRKSPLYDMMRYHLGWQDEQGKPVNNNPGKALRPALCLFSCQAAGGDYRTALPAAAALELVHNFSLIHDDIQDDDIERRHRPTVWAIWGKPQAINAGTAMRILANSALGRLQGNGIDLEKKMWVSRRLDEISLRLIEGQYLDINFEGKYNLTVSDYLTMVSQKTGALISGSMEIGAYLGTDNKDIVEGFGEAGHKIGLAFQIKDDVLGIWGEEAETGKSAGNDILRKKKSFPVVYALEHTNGQLRNELISLYQECSISDVGVDRVLEILGMADAQVKAVEMVKKYCGEAEKVFDGLGVSNEVKKEIKDLTLFLTGRTF